jgi:hypothetical protein
MELSAKGHDFNLHVRSAPCKQENAKLTATDETGSAPSFLSDCSVKRGWRR